MHAVCCHFDESVVHVTFTVNKIIMSSSTLFGMFNIMFMISVEQGEIMRNLVDNKKVNI